MGQVPTGTQPESGSVFNRRCQQNVEDPLHERGIDKSQPPPATAGSFNPTALQADCPGFRPAAVAQLLEVVLTDNGLLYFAD